MATSSLPPRRFAHILTRLLLIAVASVSMSPARAERLPLRPFTSADGLASDRVNCAVRDSRGFVWFCTDEGLARYDGYAFKTYAIDQPGHRRVYAFIEARDDGAYWVGLQGALARFDPGAPTPDAMFTMIRPTADLPAWDVNAIADDPAGGLWIGTTNWGLYHVDRASAGEAGRADAGPLETDEAVAGSAGPADAGRRDAGQAGAEAGARRPRGGDRWRLRPVDIGLPQAGFEPSTVRALLRARDGTLWVGAGSGLYHRALDGHVERYGAADGIFANDVRAIHEDDEGRLWVGTRFGGLCVFAAAGDAALDATATAAATASATPAPAVRAPASSRRWSIVKRFTEQDGLAGAFIAAILPASDGMIWAAAYGGLSHLARQGPVDTGIAANIPGSQPPRSASRADARAGQATSRTIATRGPGVGAGAPVPMLTRTYTTRQGLTGTGMTALVEDAAGNLWIGTEDAGVIRLAREGLVTYTHDDGLAMSRFTALLDGGSGAIYAVGPAVGAAGIAGYDARIGRFDGRAFTSLRPNVPRGVYSGWGWHQLWLHDRAGAWWVPTGRGLYRFSHVPRFDALATQRPERFTTRDGLPSDEIFRLYEDRRGDVWIGTMTDGASRLTRWTRATGRFRVFGRADGVPEDAPTAFAEDRDGRLWIGFYGGAIARYDPVTGRVEQLPPPGGPARGMIRALHVDATAGRVWIATGSRGLGRIDDPAAWPPRIVWRTSRDGLSSDDIWSITEDRWGRLYVGTGRGLDRLDRVEPGHVRHFTSRDGLAPGSVLVSLRASNDDLWFATAQGLSRLVPEPDQPRPPPPIVITGLRVAGVPVAVPEIGARTVPPLLLASSQNHVEIDFVGLGPGAGAGLRYRYRLEGADDRWSQPATEHRVNFARLSPGAYRFVVQAVGAGGERSGPPTAVSFTIQPPLWRRWWALAAGGLGLAALLYLTYRYRVAQLLELERVRTRIATDLHDDVGTSVSRMAIMSEVLMRGGVDGPGAYRLLADIADTSRTLVEGISDSVWSIDPRRDDLASVVARLRAFASDLFEARGIAWTFDAPVDLDGIRLSSDRRRHLFLLLKEAITNIARHAGATHASIAWGRVGHMLIIDVRDDGRGFAIDDDAHAARRTGRGLENMRTRAQRIGAQLAILSGTPGEGTRLRLMLTIG